MNKDEQIKYWKGVRYETRRSLWGQRPSPFVSILRERLDFANAEIERLSQICPSNLHSKGLGIIGTIQRTDEFIK
jgi:hypothetical protein